ncbi:hypothetical protein CBM2609_A20064 [Cupriavidus taiwanensis]|nr:hypothetical protein CBM2604_A20064 [Cupriavidus taiwanensis]SOZ26403.1 hypothetical protein CBM2609_A20064 [Cupriavidus taiwanensis]SOZ45267.1 hypothetical protein CBM2610_A20053 [Cupriavidus taiwanensis]
MTPILQWTEYRLYSVLQQPGSRLTASNAVQLSDRRPRERGDPVALNDAGFPLSRE